MSEETFSLEVEKIINSPAAMVFDAWLDQNNISKWLMPGEGVIVPNPKIDPKVGGKFDLTMKVGDNLLPHSGEYKKIDRPNELEFTWNSPHGTNGTDTLVLITFESINESQTKVKLKHTFLPTQNQRDDHSGGWARILDCLESVINL